MAATAMEEGEGKDPLPTIAGTFMKWIANSPFKFLGKQVCTDGSDKAARKLSMQKFKVYVTKMDETPLTGSQKMWIFDKVLMSKISWDFLIHDMTVSFVEDLAATQTRMFKKWVNYSRSGNPTVFYRSKKIFGWNMKQMITFFKKQQLIKCNMLKCSEDSDVRQLYEARCQKEYNASISKTQMISQVWRPTVEERTCAQAAAHKKRTSSQNVFYIRR